MEGMEPSLKRGSIDQQVENLKKLGCNRKSSGYTVTGLRTLLK
jgi:hypothetical protein